MSLLQLAVLLFTLVALTNASPINGRSPTEREGSPMTHFEYSAPKDMPPGIYEPMLQYQMRAERSATSSEEMSSEESSSSEEEDPSDLLIRQLLDAPPQLDPRVVIEQLMSGQRLPVDFQVPVSRSKRGFWDPYVEWWCTTIKLWCSNWRKSEEVATTTTTTTEAPVVRESNTLPPCQPYDTEMVVAAVVQEEATEPMTTSASETL